MKRNLTSILLISLTTAVYCQNFDLTSRRLFVNIKSVTDVFDGKKLKLKTSPSPEGMDSFFDFNDRGEFTFFEHRSDDFRCFYDDADDDTEKKEDEVSYDKDDSAYNAITEPLKTYYGLYRLRGDSLELNFQKLNIFTLYKIQPDDKGSLLLRIKYPATVGPMSTRSGSTFVYNQILVLEKLARVLNKSNPTAKALRSKEIYVKDNAPENLTVYDLVDTLNNTSFKMGSIENNRVHFKENHVYHFSAMDGEFTYSHILILQKGKLKIFKSINCPNGDKLNDVLKYLDKVGLADAQLKKNVANCGHFGKYHGICGTAHLICDKNYGRVLRRAIRQIKRERTKTRRSKKLIETMSL